MNTLPTKPGFYWWIYDAAKPPLMVRLRSAGRCGLNVDDCAGSFSGYPLDEDIGKVLLKDVVGIGEWHPVATPEDIADMNQRLIDRTTAYEAKDVAQFQEIRRLKQAVLAAIPCLDHDRDLSDLEIIGTSQPLIDRRLALRKCQAALVPPLKEGSADTPARSDSAGPIADPKDIARRWARAAAQAWDDHCEEIVASLDPGPTPCAPAQDSGKQLSTTVNAAQPPSATVNSPNPPASSAGPSSSAPASPVPASQTPVLPSPPSPPGPRS